jgi:hypothetical protein
MFEVVPEVLYTAPTKAPNPLVPDSGVVLVGGPYNNTTEGTTVTGTAGAAE